MSQPNQLTATQERFTYEAGEIEIEHYHRYQLALGLAKEKRVLDIASGEGYGSNPSIFRCRGCDWCRYRS